MVGGTHQDRIIALLSEYPGLDDDEIAHRLGIPQRQQVNQICRLMERRGQLRRRRPAGGKIQNYLVTKSEGLLEERTRHQQRRDVPGGGGAPRKAPCRERVEAKPSTARSSRETVFSGELSSTLIILPCSAAKARSGDQITEGSSVLDSLPGDIAAELVRARDMVRGRANIDESSRMPAWRRYQGTLYQSAGEVLSKVARDQTHILILSGGYGIVSAIEGIGTYDAVFKPSWWPRGLLERVLAAYASAKEIRHVRAFVSASTSYRKIVERVDWRSAGVEDAILLVPDRTAGAMVKAPRAQGEALASFLEGELSPEWTSSDGLSLDVINVLDVGG